MKFLRKMPRPQLFLRKSNNDEPVLARFSQCILDYFESISQVFVQLDHSITENRYVVTKVDEKSPNSILLVHAPICPIRRLSEPERIRLESEMARTSRRPGVAASAIIESSDDHVLLTRRAKTLRSFPGIWVGPGGYTDPDETTVETILRETQEETGLSISKMRYEIDVLNLWESGFPPIPIEGSIERHDIVVYYHIKLGLPAKDLMDFEISHDEVDMVCWIPRTAIHSIAYSIPDGHDSGTTLEILTWEDGQKKLTSANVPLSELISMDNVSAGTKFAMRRMLEKKL